MILSINHCRAAPIYPERPYFAYSVTDFDVPLSPIVGKYSVFHLSLLFRVPELSYTYNSMHQNAVPWGVYHIFI